MKGLKILLTFGLLLFVTGVQSIPIGEIQGDGIFIEAPADYEMMPVIDFEIFTAEFTNNYTYIQEGWVDDYSFTEILSVTDDNITLTKDFDYSINKATRYVDLEFPIYDIQEHYWQHVHLLCDDELYTSDKNIHIPVISFFMIC